MASLLAILKVTTLLASTWGVGQAVEVFLGWPALIAEICVGMVFGPGGLDLIPYAEAIALVGQMGLLLLVLEGGLNIELGTLKKLGWKSFAIALTGTALPVLCTWSMLPMIPGIKSKEALVAGTALSSTAIGMAAKLMGDLGLLKQYLGQLICCAAMIDDVASLVLLAMISNATPNKSGNTVDDGDDDKLSDWGPEGGLLGVFIPLLTSTLFMFLSYFLAAYMPLFVVSFIRFFNSFLNQHETTINNLPDNIMMFLLFTFTVGMTLISQTIRSTSLLGCFMAGVSFASVEGALECWERSLPSISSWTSRIFFASIGFAIPVSELFSVKAFGIGLFLTVIAIASKLVSGAWEWDHKFTVGWAMVGRGELGFVMAEQSYRLGLTSELVFAVTVWALLLATLISPLAFKKCTSISDNNIIHDVEIDKTRIKDGILSQNKNDVEMMNGHLEIQSL